MKSGFKIAVQGAVQGVGFRPFIYNLALRFSLNGAVYNDDSGVKISIYGERASCLDFINALQNELPPLARIDKLDISKLNYDEKIADFKILASKSAQKIAPILSDFAICDDCKKEFYDKQNARYHHAFINCTNCGPRFSIIRALPYDRANTTMSSFAMCKSCKQEYSAPTNRRFHAQPIACNHCGANAYLKDNNGGILAKDENAFKLASDALKDGKILAIKGLGGFHLCVDALNFDAIQKLRELKKRPHKPFAVMLKDESQASLFCDINNAELKLLNSAQKPIVLAKKAAKNASYLEWIAPKLDKIGIFIAPTAFNLLLFEYFPNPIIATSANISGESIISSFDELKAKLGVVFHLALDHDRDIINASDDSVAFCLSFDEKLPPITQFLRTSRGFKPSIINTNYKQKSCILALGSELKNSFAIYKDGLIFLSPYIGDLKNILSFKRLLALIEFYKLTYNFSFDLVLGDLHPHFMHTKHFESLGYKMQRLQHHKAHIYSVMCEHDLGFDSEILGFGFDGTGYGEDGNIWGGEIFKNSANQGLERIYHFDNFALIGSQNAIKNINFLAFAILQKYNINAPAFYKKLGEKAQFLKAALNASKVQTNSLGRIFDALASLVCDIDEISYDAQGAMSLEALYDESLDICYDFEIKGQIIGFKGIFERALKDEPRAVASGFINVLAKLICNIACKEREQKPNISVVLGGGVFANAALLGRTIKLLENAGIKYYLPKANPAGDEAIALGQIYYALNKTRD